MICQKENSLTIENMVTTGNTMLELNKMKETHEETIIEERKLQRN
jgi:hypothetical protein